MSRLDVNTLRHTAGSADNITLDNSQNVTIEGNLTVDGTLSGVSLGAALTGSTNNQITTVTGANAIQGEANLTFDGSTLTHKATNDLHHMMESGTAGYCRIAMGDSDDDNIGQILYNNANNKWDITGNAAVRVEIESDGDVKINTGNLIIGTAGKGIDFSANSGSSATGASTTSELLDFYEEGTWTPVFESTSTDPTYSNWHTAGTYIRIGGMCYVWFDPHQITFSGTAAAGYGYISGFPFASTDNGSLACGKCDNVLKWAGVSNKGDRGFSMASAAATGEFNTDAPSRGFTWDVGDGSSKGYFDLGGGYKCV